MKNEILEKLETRAITNAFRNNVAQATIDLLDSGKIKHINKRVVETFKSEFEKIKIGSNYKIETYYTTDNSFYKTKKIIVNLCYNTLYGNAISNLGLVLEETYNNKIEKDLTDLKQECINTIEYTNEKKKLIEYDIKNIDSAMGKYDSITRAINEFVNEYKEIKYIIKEENRNSFNDLF